jgi:hypothetical protein
MSVYVCTEALILIILGNQFTLSMGSIAEAVLPVVDIYLCINFWLCCPELTKLYGIYYSVNKRCSIKLVIMFNIIFKT